MLGDEVWLTVGAGVHPKGLEGVEVRAVMLVHTKWRKLRHGAKQNCCCNKGAEHRAAGTTWWERFSPADKTGAEKELLI